MRHAGGNRAFQLEKTSFSSACFTPVPPAALARKSLACANAVLGEKLSFFKLEKTLFFSACNTLVSIATCAHWDLVSACATLEEKRSF